MTYQLFFWHFNRTKSGKELKKSFRIYHTINPGNCDIWDACINVHDVNNNKTYSKVLPTWVESSGEIDFNTNELIDVYSELHIPKDKIQECLNDTLILQLPAYYIRLDKVELGWILQSKDRIEKEKGEFLSALKEHKNYKIIEPDKNNIPPPPY